MTVTADVLPSKPDFTVQQFVGGIMVHHGAAFGLAGFRYADDVWHPLDLLKAGQVRSLASIRFSRVVQWLRPDARRWVASAWLERSISLSHMQATLTALGHLGTAVPTYDGTVASLVDEHAEAVRAHLTGLWEAGRLGAASARGIAGNLNAFVQFIRSLPENDRCLGTFHVRLPKRLLNAIANQTALGADPQKVIPIEVIAALLRACEEEERALRTVEQWRIHTTRPDGLRMSTAQRRKVTVPRPPDGLKLPAALNRAIKAQALKVAICVGRRITAVAGLPLNPRVQDRVTKSGRRVVRIELVEQKISSQPEWVTVPSYYADVLLDAISKATEWGARIRAANPSCANLLFVGSSGAGGYPLNGAFFNHYLHGKEEQKGLLERYGIRRDGEATYITSHNWRTTRATRLLEGKAKLHEVRQDLGHHDLLMTAQFYGADTPELRRVAEDALKTGAVSGEVHDLVMGRAIGERVTPRMVEQLRRNGVVVNVTRYGFCFLPADTGPCPTGNPCWQGIDPTAPEVREGLGCEWQGLTPAALPQLRHDEGVLLDQVARYQADPRFAHFVGNLFQRLLIVQRQIERAESLAPMLPTSSADG